MNSILLVGLGGAAGSIIRYLLQRQFNGPQFPWGTLAVNIAGSLLAGLLMGLALRGMNDSAKLLGVVGFCGGFTTFSALTMESIQLLQAGRTTAFFTYVLISLATGIFAAYAGFKLSQI